MTGSLFMKRIFIILAACAALCSAQEAKVETSVLNFRRSYRIPTIEGTSRMTLTLGFTPPAGYVVREQPELQGSIKGVDATGKSLECRSSSLVRSHSTPGGAQAELAVVPHPKGDWLRLQGQVKLILGSDIKTLPRHKLSLTEKSQFTLDGITFSATPAAANKAKNNIERGRLNTAEVTLTYPSTVTVMRICRIWEGADIAESADHHQELDTLTERGKDGKTRLYVSLWDTRPEEMVEIVICKNKHKVDVPVDLKLNLGGVVPKTTKE